MSRVITSLATSCLFTVVVVMSGCANEPQLPPDAGFGPSPTLPPPQSSVLPKVNVAPAEQWQNGRTPTAAPGLAVKAFAEGLDHPRWLYVLPNGDVLVA